MKAGTAFFIAVMVSAGLAHAEPDYVQKAIRPTCFASACHVYTSGAIGAGHWIEHINGVAQAGPPYSVTVMPGQSFTLDFRGRGLTKPVPPPAQQHDPDVSGVIVVENYQTWNVSTGPTWNDNGYSGATPWVLTATAYNLYISNFAATESRNNKYGATDDVGDTAGSYTDKNRLGADEVMSATIAPSIFVNSGPHYITISTMGYHEDYGAVAGNSLITVNVLAPTTPVNTATPTLTPAVVPTNTYTQTFMPSPTPLAACGSGTVSFGNNFIGAQSGIRYQLVTALKYSVTQTGTLATVSLYTGFFGACNISAALYSDSGGKPNTLLSQSSAQAIPASSGWNTLSMPAVAVSPGTYWLAYQQSAFPGASVPYDYNVFGDSYSFAQNFGAFPATVPTPNTTPYSSGFSQQVMPIYASLCVVGGSPTFTPTRTATRTLSPSPTFTRTTTATPTTTASSTGTITLTVTTSISPTSTATPTSTASLSPSPSFTRTASPTSTATPTDTVTGSSTSTVTLSSTRTVTPSATPSSSSTVTLSATPTSTCTVTRTQTPPPAGSTATDTPSITETFSASPTFSDTATVTLSASPTPSATASSTASPTPSSSATATSTHSPSATSSSTPSATGTATSTLSPSPSFSPTLTASPSPSSSVTPSATGTASASSTASPTPSATSTASPSATASASVTPTGSFTATPSITASFSASPSASQTPTVTATPTVTVSFTASPTNTVASSQTVTPVITPTSNSFTAVLAPVLAPDPINGSMATLAYRLVAGAENVQVRFYTPALQRVLTTDLGARAGGLNIEPFSLPADLPNQLYFVQLIARSGRQETSSSIFTLYVLR